MYIKFERNGTIPIIKINDKFIFEHYHSFENKNGINIDKFRAVLNPEIKIYVKSNDGGPEYNFMVDDVYVNKNEFTNQINSLLEAI